MMVSDHEPTRPKLPPSNGTIVDLAEERAINGRRSCARGQID